MTAVCTLHFPSLCAGCSSKHAYRPAWMACCSSFHKEWVYGFGTAGKALQPDMTGLSDRLDAKKLTRRSPKDPLQPHDATEHVESKSCMHKSNLGIKNSAGPGTDSASDKCAAGGAAKARAPQNTSAPSSNHSGYTKAELASLDDPDQPPNLESDEESVTRMHYSDLAFNSRPSSRGSASGRSRGTERRCASAAHLLS